MKAADITSLLKEQVALFRDFSAAQPVEVMADDRELISGDVMARIPPRFALAIHLDTDGANAASIRDSMSGRFDGIRRHLENP